MNLIERLKALRATTALVPAAVVITPKPKAEAPKPAVAAEGETAPKNDDAPSPAAPAAPAEPAKEPEKTPEAAPAAAAAAEPAAIAELCAANNAAHLAAGLIREGVTLEQAKERINVAGQIRSVVADARKINPALDTKLADELIGASASADHARVIVMERLVAAQSGEITSATRPATEGASASSWDHALKANGITPKAKK